MAGFLRRKSKNQRQEPVTLSTPPSTLTSIPTSIPSTPLYARFATTSSESQSRNAPSPSRVLVSQPMALGSRGPTLSGSVKRQPTRQLETPKTPQYGTPKTPHSDNPNNVRNNHESGATVAQSTRSSQSIRTPVSQRQMEKPVPRVSPVDKPLPIPAEQRPSLPHVLNVSEKEPIPLINPLPQPRPAPSFGTGTQLINRSMAPPGGRQSYYGELSTLSQVTSSPKLPPIQPTLSSSVQQPVVRRHANDPRSIPTRSQAPVVQNSTVPRPVRRELPQASLIPDIAVTSPPPAGNTQLRTTDNAPFPKAVAANGPTASTNALRKGASVPEPKLATSGDYAPPRSQKTLKQNTGSATTNSPSLGSVTLYNDHGIRSDSRPLRNRPMSPVSSDDDDLFVDAHEEPKSVTPTPDARELPPVLALNQDHFAQSLSNPVSSPAVVRTANSQPSLVSRPPLPGIDSALRGLNNMGTNISYPAQNTLPPSSIVKVGQRRPLPPSPAEGPKMRSINQNPSLRQPFEPTQDPTPIPQITPNNAPTRGKPLIFAAMEANIDQPHLGEEQRVSVHVWDGQDHSSGQSMTSYATPSSSSADQMRPKAANGSPNNAAAAEYPSPPSSELAYPRAGKIDGHQEPPQSPAPTPTNFSRPRKLSKPRNVSDNSEKQSQRNGTEPGKARPLTPVSPGPPTPKKAVIALGSPIQLPDSSEKQGLQVPSSRQTARTSGMALLDNDGDPFARVEGVRMLAPQAATKENEKGQERHLETRNTKARNAETSQERSDGRSAQLEKQPSIEIGGDGKPLTNGALEDARSERSSRHNEKRISSGEGPDVTREEDVETRPTSPSSVEDGLETRSIPDIDSTDASSVKDEGLPFPLVEFVSDVRLLSELLGYLSFYEWCTLSSVSKNIRTLLSETESLREAALERHLKTVGYVKWCWDGPDPLTLSLQDLSDYMFGVSTPTHEYARVADLYVKSVATPPTMRDPALHDMVLRLTAATRAYSRVVLRLRAQAEKDAASRASALPARGNYSRPPSRASSPARSSFSHGNSPHGRGSSPQQNVTTGPGFKSPLFRPKRAPLLRVFVPSPDGDWLSDKSVIECEAECKRAGINKLMRFGDVVWDVAVGDESNIGRLIWDGSYLLDLDYSYSPVGDLPKYVPALAFPPSYFHKIIRTGPGYSNPVVRIDLRPWGEQLAANLQLLQDRIRTETPQGALRNVVRWVHRSSFVVRPLSNTVRMKGFERIPIPDYNGLFVDPGWYGTIVVETEGTNESLADLQDRCGPGVFPPRATGVAGQLGINPAADARKVFRVLREKSRPGEIWVKAVGVKEKLL